MPKLVDVVAFVDADNRLVAANNLVTASHVRPQLDDRFSTFLYCFQYFLSKTKDYLAWCSLFVSRFVALPRVRNPRVCCAFGNVLFYVAWCMSEMKLSLI